MRPGCSHRAMQRSTSASSSSSISSKWQLATPSLLKGHSLSEGCSSGECEGRNSEGVSLLEPLEFLLRRVPSGLIDYEQDAFPLSRSHFPGEVLKRQGEHFRANGG